MDSDPSFIEENALFLSLYKKTWYNGDDDKVYYAETYANERLE